MSHVRSLQPLFLIISEDSDDAIYWKIPLIGFGVMVAIAAVTLMCRRCGFQNYHQVVDQNVTGDLTSPEISRQKVSTWL